MGIRKRRGFALGVRLKLRRTRLSKPHVNIVFQLRYEFLQRIQPMLQRALPVEGHVKIRLIRFRLRKPDSLDCLVRLEYKRAPGTPMSLPIV